MCFELTVLGSAAALPDSAQISTAQVLKFKNSYFLFDCAEGTQIRLRQNNISFARISHIFISHLHGDHYYGIFGLITSFNLLGRRRALNIYANAELQNQIKTVLSGDQPNFPLHFHALGYEKETMITETDSYLIKSFPLKHRIPTCGFRFQEKARSLNIKPEAIKKYQLTRPDILKVKSGRDYITKSGDRISYKMLTLPPLKTRSFAFCSDTAYDEHILEHIKGVDILYHECTFSEKDQELADKTQHSTATDAAKTAKNAEAKQLLLGHFSNRYPNRTVLTNQARKIFPDSFAVKDNDKYSVPQERLDEHP